MCVHGLLDKMGSAEKKIKAGLRRWSHLKVGTAAGGMREASSTRATVHRLS